jgi:hypothetical protein
MGMTKGDELSFDEPKMYTISKFRLYVSIIGIVIIIGVMIFNQQQPPMVCFAALVVFVIFQFLPFTYKLIVSNEAISSIDFLGIRTLGWNEVAEIGIKNGNFLLHNNDGDIKVVVNQQIDDFPEVLKFIKQQRPELWHSAETDTFHQNASESVVLIIMSVLIFLTGAWAINIQGLNTETILPIVFILALSLFLFVDGSMKVQKISLDGDTLVLHKLFWKRRFHVSEVWSVGLEQKFGKQAVLYPVHIKIRNKKDIVVENVKEGNPFIVNAIEMWIEKYKGRQNDHT